MKWVINSVGSECYLDRMNLASYGSTSHNINYGFQSVY